MTEHGEPARWQASLAYALTGREIALPEPGCPDLPVLVAKLADAGWGRVEMLAHAKECAAAGRPWPHRVPPGLRAGCGAAQLHAALRGAQELLGLETLVARPASKRTELTPDEFRLLREVPPHHGS